MNSYWVSKNVFNRRNNNWKSWADKGIVAGLIDEIGIKVSPETDPEIQEITREFKKKDING